MSTFGQLYRNGNINQWLFKLVIYNLLMISNLKSNIDFTDCFTILFYSFNLVFKWPDKNIIFKIINQLWKNDNEIAMRVNPQSFMMIIYHFASFTFHNFFQII